MVVVVVVERLLHNSLSVVLSQPNKAVEGADLRRGGGQRRLRVQLACWFTSSIVSATAYKLWASTVPLISSKSPWIVSRASSDSCAVQDRSATSKIVSSL